MHNGSALKWEGASKIIVNVQFVIEIMNSILFDFDLQKIVTKFTREIF